MRRNQASVFLVLNSVLGPLLLERQPKYLRFTLTGSDWKTLDALDQLDDEPKESEHLIAAVKSDESSAHFSGYRDGKRAGWWEKTVTYKPVQKQPTQEVMRDREQWQAWVVEQMSQEDK